MPLTISGIFGHCGHDCSFVNSTRARARVRPARQLPCRSPSAASLAIEHPVILGLRDVGLVDGKTATILVREAEGNPDRLSQLAAELVAQKPDVIITAGPQPIAAVKNATTTIPIVMAIVSDPVTYGFVDSLSQPGGNLTGHDCSFVNSPRARAREGLQKLTPSTRARAREGLQKLTPNWDW